MKRTTEGFVSCLRQISDFYNQTGNVKHYAYEKAIFSIENTKNAFNEIRCGHKVKYVGESISKKFKEYMSTGGVRLSADSSEIGTDLMFYPKENKVPTSDNTHKHYQKRMVIKRLIDDLCRSGGVTDYHIAGSYRRGSEYCGDGDFIITDRDQYNSLRNYLSSNQRKWEVVSQGDKKLKIIRKYNGEDFLEVDIRMINKESLGTALLYFTGPKEFNINLRSTAKSKGFKLNEYSITNLSNGEEYKFESENEVFKFLQIEYKSPVRR